MKVYILQNGDGIIMGIFLKKAQAEKAAIEVGLNRWHEAWTVTVRETGSVDTDMLCGSESYRKAIAKRENKQ